MHGSVEEGGSVLSSNRRKYFRRNRKAIRRDQTQSVTGVLSGSFGLLALILFAFSVGLTFRKGGSAGFLLGTAGLFGLVLAVGAFVLGILAFREKNIRPIPPRTGMVLGGIFAVVYIGLYIYGCLL